MAVVVAALGGLYVASPYLAAYRLRQAVIAGDADTVEAGTDLGSVKDSLKSQLSTALQRKMAADPGIRNNPFAALGALIVPAIVDKTVDTYVTPDGLANLMAGRKPGEAPADRTNATPTYASDEAYVSLDRFRITSHDRRLGQQGPSLLFERRGLVTWKLIRIELPPALFDDTSSSTPTQ